MAQRGPTEPGFGLLIFAPVVWALQFLACYVLAAVYCARFDTADLAPLRLLVLGLMLVALGLIGAQAARSMALYREHAGPPQTNGAPSRARFVALASLLLALLSGIATLLGSLPILMLERCT